MEGLAALTDADVAARARRGDRPAFEELVRRFTRLVYARIYLETGDGRKTEDLVQETFLAAWRRIGGLAEPGGVRGWLVTIAHNVCIDAFRAGSRLKRAGRAAAADLDALPRAQAEPDEEAERREARERVLSILRSMPEAYREPILLRYLLGCDHRQIAAQLGLGEGALRGQLNRGMRMLREEMKRVSRSS